MGYLLGLGVILGLGIYAWIRPPQEPPTCSTL